MPKPFSPKVALARLTSFADHAPNQLEESDIVTLFERLPPGMPMPLVTRVMKRLAKARDVEWVFRAPAEYAPAIAEVLRATPHAPLSVFLLAALPSKVEEWGAQTYELRDCRDWLECYKAKKYRASRARCLEPYTRDVRVVAGAQAELAAHPDATHAMLLLALEGSEGSVDVMLNPVRALMKDPAKLDFLRQDVVPLLQAPATRALKEVIVGKAEQRNSGSWGLQAARALGMTDGTALKFKVNLFAAGDWPKLRMWFDSTRDPSCGGIWNFNEHVRIPSPNPKSAPVENLEAVLASLMQEASDNNTKWVRYTFASPARMPFKKTLAAFVAERLPKVQLTPR